MNALEILADLRRAGATVTIAGDKLRLEAPQGVLTNELKQRLATQKSEIIRLLTETTASYREGPPYPDGLGRVKCFYCSKLEITGTKATCQVCGKSMSGIALLLDCENFATQMVH